MSTKYRPRYVDTKEPHTVIGTAEGLLLDDMLVHRYACLPARPRGSHIVSVELGTEPREWWKASMDDFIDPRLLREARESETYAQRKTRALDMNSKHFELGAAGPNDRFDRPAQWPCPDRSALSGTVRRIRGKSNPMNQSSHLTSDEDNRLWGTDLVSENKRRFLPCLAARAAEPAKNFNNVTQYVLGDAPPDYSRKEYVAAVEKPPRAINNTTHHTVDISESDLPLSQTSMSRDTYVAPPPGFQRPGLAPTTMTSLALGHDCGENKTIHRGSYKPFRFIDCHEYSPEELIKLGFLCAAHMPKPSDEFKVTEEHEEAIRQFHLTQSKLVRLKPLQSTFDH